MAQTLDFDLKQVVLVSGTFGPREIEQILDVISADPSQFRVLREVVQELETKEDPSPASNVTLGVCQYLLGRYSLALSTLQRGDGVRWLTITWPKRILARRITRPPSRATV